ncbi:NADH-dependent flavin reductase subunit 1 [Flavobacterium bizetiae]|uniref:NADH-dependent flavin reductase subunit 1 n=1 Tax=Flavobacterium bizetiae TaxID=2704140 RepID=A0A6J4GML7_9FLAO|nr:NAD(P)H-dependent oxidoreductase [Flavobacterium bizetiae]CAA9200116.1 NADH-dependent flavin reductase subunit 1 [Flavobacterium bizetiae]CAD5343440.1 NADH-dependent flavin reductase subunit 1 [Flavobacterium bizetiae]CAD5349433.1 NADH-dependent flavin reductase subunit 1 [Flavobacterium bizetiae]
MKKTKIFAISGSTRGNSSNYRILKFISEQISDWFELEIFEELDQLPHFNPDLDNENPPEKVAAFRTKIENADGVLICTPEYVFSLPGSLKNALEWCVSTTIFSDKKVGLITASASGEMAHEQLILIMKTLQAQLDENTQLLMQGIRGKINEEGKIINGETNIALQEFISNFENLFLVY